MTDFTRFLNSKSIAEHLRKIDYRFEPEEAAFVVHEARNVPLSEKHEAYGEIIANYPDAVLKKRNGDFETQPLAEFLTKFMMLENEYVAECKTPSPNAAYVYSVYTEDMDGNLFWFDEDDVIYGTYEECFLAASGEQAAKIRVAKRYFGGREYVELYLLPDGTVLSVDVGGKRDGITDGFDWFWISLPTPFRRGDILRSVHERKGDASPDFVVLEKMIHWSGKELADNGFVDSKGKPDRDRKRNELDFAAWERANLRHKESGDSSDMNFDGFEIDSDGNVVWDVYMTYLDYELCLDLPKDKKALVALSAFMKGEIAEDLLLNAYRHHTLRAALAKAEEILPLYTDAGLETAGITARGGRDEEKRELKDET